MKTYRYVTLGLDDVSPKYYTLTEKDILDKNFSSWSKRMQEKGLNEQINETNCIEEWVRDNCAWEV